MKDKSKSQPIIFNYSPNKLMELADEQEFPLTWEEMIQDIELGDEEFTLLLKLSEEADMSMVQVLLFFLHYWEDKTEEELGEMYGMSHMTISRELEAGRNKLYNPLKKLIAERLA